MQREQGGSVGVDTEKEHKIADNEKNITTQMKQIHPGLIIISIIIIIV